MVVTPDSRATQAALDVIQKGGNAVDALVTAQAVLNVVEPQASGIGGAGFLLFYDAGTRTVLFFDGSAKAPARAHPAMFLQPDKNVFSYDEARTSGLAVGVPGTVKLLWEIHARYTSGKFSFSKLLEPAIQFAENGITVSEPLALAFEANRETLSASGYFQDVFLKGQSSLKTGDKIVLTDLAETFRILQRKGADAFYSGEISGSIVTSAHEKKRRQKLLTKKDLGNYGVRKRDPLYIQYEGYDLFTAGPPSAAGVMVFSGCGILSELSLSSFSGKPESVHFVNEAIKLSSRVPHAIGDPDFFDLPVKAYLSAEWAQKQAAKVQRGKVYKMSSPMEGYEEKERGRASASILIRDKGGNLVAYTGALGDPFGSGIMARGRGFFLNDLLLDFDVTPALTHDPEAPNVPGPEQRPRNFFAPVFVFKEGKPFLVLNSPGGSEASSIVLNMLVQRLNFNASCEDTMAASRIMARDGVMCMEKKLYDEETLRVQMELWGHKVQPQNALGDAQMVCFEKDSAKMIGVADPRGKGEAAGF